MNQITLLDGAQGTLLWQKAEAQGIPKASVWTYNLTHPELVSAVCREYADAGSEIICANTFGINRFTVERESTASVPEAVTAAIHTAKEALLGTEVLVALDVGPLPMMTEPYGDLSEEETEEIFDEIIEAGSSAGADLIFLETFMQIEMLAAAFRAAKKTGLPVFASMSFEASGRTLFGVSVEDMLEELSPMGPAAVGMNCSVGPDLAVPVITEFAEKTEFPLILKPNAGVPVTGEDGTARYTITAEEFCKDMAAAPDLGRSRYLGGCCGTNPDFIRALRTLIA